MQRPQNQFSPFSAESVEGVQEYRPPRRTFLGMLAAGVFAQFVRVSGRGDDPAPLPAVVDASPADAYHHHTQLEAWEDELAYWQSLERVPLWDDLQGNDALFVEAIRRSHDFSPALTAPWMRPYAIPSYTDSGWESLRARTALALQAQGVAPIPPPAHV